VNEKQLEQRADEISQRVREEVLRQLKSTGRSMDEIERAVEDLGRRFEAEVEQAIVDLQPDPSALDNTATCPRCQAEGRYRATEEREWTTLHGVRRIRRRRYYCGQCQAGFVPRDAELKLDAGKLSYALRERCCVTAALVDSFATAQQMVAVGTGVHVGETTIARIAVAVGKSLATAEKEQVARHRRGGRLPVKRKPRRLYVSVDGIQAPLRQAWKRDGSQGKLVCEYKECKTAVIYETDQRVDPKTGVLMDRKPIYREYTATFEASGGFGQRVAALARQAGANYAKQVVFLADGQKYNWSIAAAHFPRAVKIVDEMHAFEHVSEVAQTFFGAGTGPAQAWTAARKEELRNDQVAQVVRAIKDLVPGTEEQRKTQVREAGYFRNNQARMKYKSFRSQGYQVASGVMEAACKQVVHQRIDQVGMHWTKEHADSIAILRAKVLSTERPNIRAHCIMAA
jgi:hypothetical protein